MSFSSLYDLLLSDVLLVSSVKCTPREQNLHPLIQSTYRIPITPDRGIEDNYLDAYLRIILQTSPTDSALVFSSGTGATQTTLAMVAACVVRRKQLLERGYSDPFTLPHTHSTSASGFVSRTGTPGIMNGGIDPSRSSVSTGPA
jgi:hypothetical protein